MRLYITLAIIAMPAAFAYSQLQKIELPKWVSIGKWKMGGTSLSEMFYSIDDDKDTIYHWQYNNAEYTHITDLQYIDFANEGNTLNELYEILAQCFDKDSDHQESVKLGKDLIIITVKKTMGAKYLFISPPRGYFSLTKAGLKKLFNKK
jgi:hypothetical protein